MIIRKVFNSDCQSLLDDLTVRSRLLQAATYESPEIRVQNEYKSTRPIPLDHLPPADSDGRILCVLNDFLFYLQIYLWESHRRCCPDFACLLAMASADLKRSNFVQAPVKPEWITVCDSQTQCTIHQAEACLWWFFRRILWDFFCEAI